MWRNWAGNQTATAAREVHPESRDEVVAAVRAAATDGLRVRAVGAGHSFTAAAATDGVRLVLDRYAGPVEVDPAAGRVTVPGGLPLWRLNELLAGHGLALPNLGDIDRQTVAGAISTGTHGTGARFGGLATFVSALELVTGTGEVVRCSADRRPELLAAARVGLGALGVVTAVTLDVVAAFTLRADERPARLAAVLAGLDEEIAGNDHFEFYWFPYTRRVLIKRNNRVAPDEPARPLPRWRRWLDDELLANTVFEGACRLGRVAPATVPTLNRISARALGARTYTDRSDRVFCTPRRVRFLEMEYALPVDALTEAIAGLPRLIAGCGVRVGFPVEVRFAAADGCWLSTAYQRDTAYVAVHQFVGAPYEPYFRTVEALLTALGGRPHWGKLHTLSAAALADRYPRFADFQALRDELDPDRVFANQYLDRVLGP